VKDYLIVTIWLQQKGTGISDSKQAIEDRINVSYHLWCIWCKRLEEKERRNKRKRNKGGIRDSREAIESRIKTNGLLNIRAIIHGTRVNHIHHEREIVAV
jgi:hypothetical protein